MNFEELIQQLPMCPGSDVLPLNNKAGGFFRVDQGLPEFIGPDVSPSRAIEQPDVPRVMIISAAGAVGKSTLAKEIAFHKQAPIWDLAQAAAVGENSVTGQITTSFGFSFVGEANTKLITGQLFLIIDALDEARVKANEAGYEAFIDNIAEIAKEATGIPFVLLGRTQTAETTWLLLEDAGISASLVSIQPFTRGQAEQYIEARIQHFDSAASNRIGEHKQPFIEARDLILDQLQRAVIGDDAGTKEAAREFLGYAPVLETVAMLLAKERNYHEFIESLKTMGKQTKQKPDRPMAILEHVVTHLLDREQKMKLQTNIRPALEKVAEETGWSAWHEL